MSDVESKPMRYGDLENLKDQVVGANLSDTQITELALVLKQKLKD